MTTEGAGIDQFLQTWTEEFTRAVEMFGGQAPVVRCSRTKKLAPTETNDLLWWKQDFVGDGRFTSWVGAKKDTWVALGGASPGEDTTEAQSTYLEMLGQAQSGTASVVSARLDTPLQCEAGQVSEAPDFETLCYGLVGIHLADAELPSLVFALEPNVERILNPEEPESKQPLPTSRESLEQAAFPGSHQSMLGRLMELELPLSIALGRATMPIKDVLKITSGSVIELDRNVGDSVELLVHGTVVARGEVVSVKGNYGVRIKEIISQQDRMHLYKRDQ